MTTDHREDQAAVSQPPQGPRPEGLIDQLRWVHDMLRRDLATVQQLSARVQDGAPASDVQEELHSLHSNGLLFQLRVNCLSYCQTLQSHHHNEDAVLFPAVRRAAPQLTAAIDRLQADHQVVAALLDRIDELANDLAHRSARHALVAALDTLSTNLLAHLQLEEATLEPVLREWSQWPEQPADRRDTARDSATS